MTNPTSQNSARNFISRQTRWIVLVALICTYVGIQNWMSSTPTELKRERLKRDATGLPTNLKRCTMIPGKIVELHTVRGQIDFVLFEQDCPKTTARIADLASKHCYDGLRFTRVEKTGLIQVEPGKKLPPPMPCEILKGLENTKGAVGMARTSDPNSATSIFYILIEPWHHLDYSYTVFGRVIRGMDVVKKIKKNDAITSTVVRALTPEDNKQFQKILQIEAERKTE